LRPIFSRAFITGFEELIRSIFPEAFLQSPVLAAFLDILPILPLIIAAIAFVIQARTGFNLRGPGREALYLPSKFREAIAFIRRVQNGQSLREKK
jgi:hypothetical protein